MAESNLYFSGNLTLLNSAVWIHRQASKTWKVCVADSKENSQFCNEINESGSVSKYSASYVGGFTDDEKGRKGILGINMNDKSQ